MFWMIALLITLFVLIVLLWSLIRSAKGSDASATERSEQNILIGRYKLAELKQDRVDGKLSESEYQLLKSELESDLHDDLAASTDSVNHLSGKSNNKPYLLIFGIIAFVPLAALAIYSWLGHPEAIILSSSPNANRKELTRAEKLQSIEVVAHKLEEKLKANPDNLRGWLMLGRTGMAIGKYDKAVKGYKHALELSPQDPSIMVSYADALAAVNGTDLSGEPEKLLKRALELQPNNKIGLWLGGMAASQRKDNKEAVKLWQRLYALIDNKSDDKERIAQLITDAGGIVAPVKPSSPAAPVLTNVTKAITVTVSLAENLKDKVVPSDIVFIYAKAVSGPPMPLAAARITVSDLPKTMVLDDSMAMMPQMTISSHNELTVGARVSKSGTPRAQPGDFFVEMKRVALGSTQTLVINSIK